MSFEARTWKPSGTIVAASRVARVYLSASSHRHRSTGFCAARSRYTTLTHRCGTSIAVLQRIRSCRKALVHGDQREPGQDLARRTDQAVPSSPHPAAADSTRAVGGEDTVNQTVPHSPPGTENAVEAISWRPADLDAARREADQAGTLVLVDFFSPT
jgi:hypothetical protein